MQFRILGRSGVRISRLALGTATFGVAPAETDADRVIGAALDAGINVIDTANVYGNLAHFDRPGVPAASERRSAEEIVGRTLGRRRDAVVLSTKVGEKVGPGINDEGLSRPHLIHQLDRSLSRLRTDHVDILYAHHPDPATPIEETVRTLDDLVQLGKTRYYALSTYPAWESVQALWMADKLGAHRAVCLQVRYSMVARQVEVEIVPAAVEFGLSLIVFSPLAGGLLAGENSRSREFSGERRWGGGAFTSSQLRAAAELDMLARAWGYEPSQLALAWVLSRPAVASALIGPETADEIATSIVAVELAANLEDAQLKELDRVGACGVIDPTPREAMQSS